MIGSEKSDALLLPDAANETAAVPKDFPTCRNACLHNDGKPPCEKNPAVVITHSRTE
jgi:hypothetical protein